MINLEKLKTYFNTPRQVSDAFDVTTSNHDGYTMGYRLKALGIVVFIVLAVTSFLNYTPWYTVAISIVIWIIGEILCKKYKAEAHELGKKELASMPASFAGIIQSNPSLFEDDEAGSGYSVIVYSTDPHIACNDQAIMDITNNLRRISSHASTPDEKYVADKLNNTRTYFSEELLKPSVTGGITSVFWTVKMLHRSNLPAHFNMDTDVFLLFVDNNNAPKYVLPGSLY